MYHNTHIVMSMLVEHDTGCGPFSNTEMVDMPSLHEIDPCDPHALSAILFHNVRNFAPCGGRKPLNGMSSDDVTAFCVGQLVQAAGARGIELTTLDQRLLGQYIGANTAKAGVGAATILGINSQNTARKLKQIGFTERIRSLLATEGIVSFSQIVDDERGLSRKRVQQAAEDGVLIAVRFVGTWCTTFAHLEEYLQRRKKPLSHSIPTPTEDEQAALLPRPEIPQVVPAEPEPIDSPIEVQPVENDEVRYVVGIISDMTSGCLDLAHADATILEAQVNRIVGHMFRKERGRSKRSIDIVVQSIMHWNEEGRVSRMCKQFDIPTEKSYFQELSKVRIKIGAYLRRELGLVPLVDSAHGNDLHAARDRGALEAYNLFGRWYVFPEAVQEYRNTLAKQREASQLRALEKERMRQDMAQATHDDILGRLQPDIERWYPDFDPTKHTFSSIKQARQTISRNTNTTTLAQYLQAQFPNVPRELVIQYAEGCQRRTGLARIVQKLQRYSENISKPTTAQSDMGARKHVEPPTKPQTIPAARAMTSVSQPRIGAKRTRRQSNVKSTRGRVGSNAGTLADMPRSAQRTKKDAIDLSDENAVRQRLIDQCPYLLEPRHSAALLGFVGRVVRADVREDEFRKVVTWLSINKTKLPGNRDNRMVN